MGGGFCLESAGVVLEEQGEHTRIGVVAEGGWSEFGEPLALIGRHRIADGVVVEANGRGRALIEEAEFLGGVFVAEAQRVADHAERVGRELRERVVELGERCLELVVPRRPTVEVTCRSGRVGVVEDLFVIALALRELAIPVAERVVDGAAYRPFDRFVLCEERFRHPPHVGDELFGSVSDQQEEAVVSTRGIDGGEFGGCRRRKVDGGDERAGIGRGAHEPRLRQG